MKDEDKTKDEFINELAKMRQRITELETSSNLWRKQSGNRNELKNQRMDRKKNFSEN